MSTWAGFSEEDLQKFQKKNNNETSFHAQSNEARSVSLGIKPTSGSKPRPRHAVQPMKKHPASANGADSLGSASLLSTNKSPEDDQKTTESAVSTRPSPSSDSKPSVNQKKSNEHPPPEPKESADLAQSTPQVAGSALLTDDDGRDRDLSNLQQYQQQQKMMEELNKKKKQMLAEALAMRQKQATVEAHKLNSIKKELSALDQMLTADVNVIRDRIEQATRDYADASKRYEEAEKEFVASKVNLHRKSELKEQLTEHLYTIIHQNEIRKAKKLAELMEKLNLASNEENDNTSNTLPDLPSYSLLGNMQTVGSGNLIQHSSSQQDERQSSEGSSQQVEESKDFVPTTDPSASANTEATELPTSDTSKQVDTPAQAEDAT